MATKDVLRVALDSRAVQAFESMAVALKSVDPAVQFSPSELVSFIVYDFSQTYFQKDFDVLLAMFFNSQSYVKTQTKKSNSENFEEVLREALDKARKMKLKMRKTITPKTLPEPSKSIASEADEKV